MTLVQRRPRAAIDEITSFGQLNRSELMSRIRSTGNRSTEDRLVRLLQAAGIVGWRRHVKLPGRPDFCWRKARVVVFVDGCFWHGHKCAKNITPKRNVEFWEAKIYGNRRRDRMIAVKLRVLGWRVIRIWECKLRCSPHICIRRIDKALEKHQPL
jgi:DNA mismatch endonuclease, patch repair protein